MSAKTPKHTRALHKLHKRKSAARHSLATRFPHVEKKLRNLQFDLGSIRRHSAKVLSAAVLVGGLLTTSPAIKSTIQPPLPHHELKLSPEQLTDLLRAQMSLILPEKVGPISKETEQKASEYIWQTLGIHAKAELEGNHLNTSYGYMGAEQHLPRFPGDTIDQHDELQVKGITAGRGAFGHFAPSKEAMTEEDMLEEKYYVAVQTLYLPNWNTEYRTLKEWYKFRKVLVVNPHNGKSIVAVVGDAGPAAWTGKHFGGSPEVMAHLGLNRGKQKGAVLLFFVDEQNGKVALGPVDAKPGAYLAHR